MKRFAFILSLITVAVASSPLMGQEEFTSNDRSDYDLYDRMRSGDEFNDNNYPNPQQPQEQNPQNEETYCPGCSGYRTGSQLYRYR